MMTKIGESIVVTGWGMVTPLGADSQHTWQALMGGDDPRLELKGREWEAFDAPRAAQALEAWMPQNLLQRDRSHQFGVLAAEEAWRKAALYRVPPDRIGSTFSSSKGGLLSLLRTGMDPSVEWDFLSDFFPYASGQILSRRFGFNGPALSVSSACSTGVASIAFGARLLREGECDAVLAGSTEASVHPLIYAGFRNMGILSRRKGGPCPFDTERDGFVMGEGAAVLALERETSAKRRKAKILARVSGWALAADAHEILEMQPDGGTIVSLMEEALKNAGLKPSDIGYINAHGTGTRLNDRIESQAIGRVFGKKGPPVSSTKSATGHLLGAAGSVEAALCLEVLNRGELPETRHLERSDPECPIRHVARGGEKGKVEHVLSLSYGFGGQLGAVIFSKGEV